MINKQHADGEAEATGMYQLLQASKRTIIQLPGLLVMIKSISWWETNLELCWELGSNQKRSNHPVILEMNHWLHKHSQWKVFGFFDNGMHIQDEGLWAVLYKN